MSERLRLVGAHASPYSRKMRSVLRYRRLPFEWVNRGGPTDVGVPPVPVGLIPVLVLPGEQGPEAMIDSSFQIQRLERESSERSLQHPDPAILFLDRLIEDYGDEWLTKPMFHYRWWYEADIDKASRVLPLGRNLQMAGEEHDRMSRQFAERQIGRLGVVGSNSTTCDLIERSYRRLLLALDGLVREQDFTMGNRPGAGDFGLFGQLTQLALFDPTSMRVCEEVAPRVIAWVEQVDDLAWREVTDDDWASREETAARLRPLLTEIGRVYAPFLLGNAAALEQGSETVECEIDGELWTQKPFPYQGKCLGWLRDGRANLNDGDRAWVDRVLEGTGCEALFS